MIRRPRWTTAFLWALASLAAGSLAAGAVPDESPSPSGPIGPIGLIGPMPSHHPDPRVLPNEELAGGATTIHDDSPTAFGRALRNLDRNRWFAMRAGKRFFENPWQPPEAVPATAPRRGLGPLYNATACADCHFRDGRGGPPPASARSRPGPAEPTLAPLLAKLARPSLPTVGRDGQAGGPDPVYGAQLNDRAAGTVPEGRLVIDDVRVATDTGTVLRRPRARVVGLARGPLDPRTRISLRIPPTLVGLGLLEAVPDAALESLADPDDRDGDGISGRVQRIPLGAGAGDAGSRGAGATVPVQVGRFGWKAGEPTIEAQVAKAFHQDLGVTSPRYPEPNCLAGDEACRAHRGEPELSQAELSRVALYVRLLAPPARRDWRDPEVLAGRDVFMAVGCGACHRPQLETARAEGAGAPRSAGPGGSAGADRELLPELAGQTIRPYTDLLLHDMGPGLDDGVAEHGAASSEWRTPPLWGLGLLEEVNGHTRFLHDGRARSFDEAILWHGGEADGAREAYLRLSEDRRSALLRFLSSL